MTAISEVIMETTNETAQSNEFWVIEYLNDEGNMIGYLKDVCRADEGGLDTYWTKDIHKALKFSSESAAQNTVDDSIDSAIGDRSRFCKVRQHAWMQVNAHKARLTSGKEQNDDRS